MPNIASAYTQPGTAMVTSGETVAQNIPVTPLALPPGAQQQVIVRVTVWVTTGAGVSSVTLKLRTGQNNTTTNQVGQSAQIAAVASTLQAFTAIFIDTVPADLPALGYTITATGNGATGNGTVTAVAYEVATTP